LNLPKLIKLERSEALIAHETGECSGRSQAVDKVALSLGLGAFALHVRGTVVEVPSLKSLLWTPKTLTVSYVSLMAVLTRSLTAGRWSQLRVSSRFCPGNLSHPVSCGARFFKQNVAIYKSLWRQVDSNRLFGLRFSSPSERLLSVRRRESDGQDRDLIVEGTVQRRDLKTTALLIGQ
jgi:hypothetical protein